MQKFYCKTNAAGQFVSLGFIQPNPKQQQAETSGAPPGLVFLALLEKPLRRAASAELQPFSPARPSLSPWLPLLLHRRELFFVWP